MKQGIFCVAIPIREDGALAKVMNEIERRLKEAGIHFTAPKIGKHITFAPPFKATDIEMHWLTAGLECAHEFYSSDGTPKMAKGKSLDFFSGDVDPLIIRIASGKNIRDLAERFRSKVPEHTEWIYPPASYLVNFHATIAEAKGLRLAIDTHGGTGKLFKGLNVEQPVQLEPPKVFQKEHGSWRIWRM